MSLERLYELRKKHNLSQEELAEKVGVARQTISKWELGETAPDIKQAQILSQIFNIGLDELFGNDTYETDNIKQDCKKTNNVPWRKIISISAAVICLFLVAIGIFDVAKRSQVLHPQSVECNVAIEKKEVIRIGKGSTGKIVYNENNKPTIVCELPETFVYDAERTGLFTDELGNFVKFGAAYADSINNPLSGTDYYSYFEGHGAQSYMDMARLALYLDLSETNVFSSKEQMHLAGGARILREQICAGQNADYYEIDGGLTKSGDKMRIYGFALCFENTTWLITLKDCNDIYYFITIKDPHGIGKTTDTIKELLSSISVAE